MDPVVIHGHPASTNTRTVRLLLEEKGAAHELRMPPFGTEAHARMHPFRKMPALSCGPVQLFESLAMASWLDEVLPGPRLLPVAPLPRAKVLGWCSASIDYLYHDVVKGFAFAAMAPAEEREAEAFAAASAQAAGRLAAFSAALEASGGPWLLGAELSLADLYLGPVVAFVRSLPEGAALCESLTPLLAHHEQLTTRPAWAATDPARV